MKSFSFIVLFIISSLVPVLPQETGEIIRADLDTVVVEAVRSGRSAMEIPFSIDYIDAMLTGRSEQGRSLDEIIFTVPGVTVSNRYSPSLGDRITIRGVGSRASFGVRGIKIILDNIPLTMPDGQSQLNNLDYGSLGSVEIIRGPSSSLYGNASGGVINIRTENPPVLKDDFSKSSFSFQPKYIAGSYNYQKLDGKISGRINDYSYIVNISNLNSDGYRENSNVKSFLANSVMRYYFTELNNLKWIFNYYNAPYALNPGALNKEEASESPQMSRAFVKLQGAGQQTTQLQTGVSSSIDFNRHSNLESSLFFITRDILNPIPGRIIDLNRNAGGFRSAYNQSFSLDKNVLNITAGADIEFQSDNRIEYVNLGLPAEMVSSIEPSEIFDNIRYGDKLLDQKENVLGIGPFVQGDFNISPITFLLGLRYDNYKFSVDDNFMEDGVDDSGERMMEKFSPFAGINFRIDALTKLFFNYSTSFQTPTTTELSNREDGQGGFNPDLLPEEIYSFETGFLRYGLIKNFNLNVSAFYMNFTNMLIPYQVSVSEEIFFANAGNAENKGVEVILEYSPIKNVVTSLSYSGYAFKFTDYLVEYEENQYIQLAGKKVPGIPANKIAAALNYQTDSGLFSTIRLLWNDKYYTNDFNGPPPGVDAPQSNFINESYFDIDFRLGYLLNTQLLNIEVFLGMNNILDEKYNGSIVPNAVAFRYFEPSAERNFYGGVKLFFPGTASSQY